jgi:hypothetical protein
MNNLITIDPNAPIKSRVSMMESYVYGTIDNLYPSRAESEQLAVHFTESQMIRFFYWRYLVNAGQTRRIMHEKNLTPTPNGETLLNAMEQDFLQKEIKVKENKQINLDAISDSQIRANIQAAKERIANLDRRHPLFEQAKIVESLTPQVIVPPSLAKQPIIIPAPAHSSNSTISTSTPTSPTQHSNLIPIIFIITVPVLFLFFLKMFRKIRSKNGAGLR